MIKWKYTRFPATLSFVRMHSQAVYLFIIIIIIITTMTIVFIYYVLPTLFYL